MVGESFGYNGYQVLKGIAAVLIVDRQHYNLARFNAALLSPQHFLIHTPRTSVGDVTIKPRLSYVCHEETKAKQDPGR